MLTQEEVDSVIDTINDRAIEIRSLIVTIGSIIAILMPAVEIVGLIDFTPYGEGDNEWIIDDDWEMGGDFTCGDGSVIEYSLVDDGYKNCRDGTDEPDEPIISPPTNNNTTVIIEPLYGCMDSYALNYNETAEEDDGSCDYEEEPEETYGCTDEMANNYDPYADYDDDSCEYDEPVEDDCGAIMYDAYVLDHNGTNLTITWDADISCEEQTYNLTVVWTVYDNSTGNFTSQNEETYETQGSAWDYVNITLANVTQGVYDIHSTFILGGKYTRGTDWYAIEVGQ